MWYYGWRKYNLNMRVAVMDLGTNVYNLLLANVKGGEWQIINEVKIPVRMGDGGLRDGILAPQAFQVATDTLREFLKLLDTWGGFDKIYAFATSAVRDAKNKNDFIVHIKRSTDIALEVISGNREAELICRGIQVGVPISQPVLMLDIGGGSNEFMIADQHRIFWKHSFPLGMARLLELFSPSNPYTPDDVQRIESHIEANLGLLLDTLKSYKISTLVGSSGTFETYRALLNSGEIDGDTFYEIDMQAYRNLHECLLKSTTEERYKMKWMPPVRVDFIVPASIFTNWVFTKAHIKKVIQSTYSLKEGAMQVVAEELSEKKAK